MNNNLACILSHCDNNEKLIALENNIKTLKKCGFDILLASHIPLGEKITSSVNYFIMIKAILYYTILKRPYYIGNQLKLMAFLLV